MHCRHRAGAGAAGGSGPEPGANGDAGRCWREVQHVAGFRHRTCEPTRQDRLLCRADVRQPRPARGLERAGSPAPVAGHRQRRRLRVGKDHHRQSQKLPGPVVRRPGHVWVVRARAEGAGSLLDAAAGGTRGQSESAGRRFQDGGLEQRRRGGYVGDPGHGGRNPGARSARHSAPPRWRDGRDCRQQRNDCRRSPRSHLTGVAGQGRSVSAQLPQLRRQRPRGSAQRDLRLEPGVEEVPRVLRR